MNDREQLGTVHTSLHSSFFCAPALWACFCLSLKIYTGNSPKQGQAAVMLPGAATSKLTWVLTCSQSSENCYCSLNKGY